MSELTEKGGLPIGWVSTLGRLELVRIGRAKSEPSTTKGGGRGLCRWQGTNPGISMEFGELSLRLDSPGPDTISQ